MNSIYIKLNEWCLVDYFHHKFRVFTQIIVHKYCITKFKKFSTYGRFFNSILEHFWQFKIIMLIWTLDTSSSFLFFKISQRVPFSSSNSLAKSCIPSQFSLTDFVLCFSSVLQDEDNTCHELQWKISWVMELLFHEVEPLFWIKQLLMKHLAAMESIFKLSFRTKLLLLKPLISLAHDLKSW